MGAFDQLPSSQSCKGVNSCCILNNNGWKKLQEDDQRFFYMCIQKIAIRQEVVSIHVWQDAQSFQEKTHTFSLSFVINQKLPWDYYLCAFEEIFNIHQCNGKFYGKYPIHAWKHKSSMTIAIMTTFQRVINKEFIFNNICMI